MKVYKILTAEQWAVMQAAGAFEGSDDDQRDGFIHLSADDQVGGTLAKHFDGQAGLVILSLEAETLGSDLRWETSRGGALFPHLYGTLPLSAVTHVVEAEAWFAPTEAPRGA